MSLLERHATRIDGVLSCFDRVIVTGTLPDFCHGAAATRHLALAGIRVFDFETKFAAPIRDAIRERIERLAEDAGAVIEYVSKKNFRMEEKVRRIAGEDERPGLVHVFSVLESNPTYRPWHDKSKGTTFLKPRDGRCLTYYVYFVDEELGLCHLRIPTWAPYRLQFYFNGHRWLARRLAREGIAFTAVDNAFVAIEDFAAAQRIAGELTGRLLHKRLDAAARRYCAFLPRFPQGVHWSIHQAEYATDVIFRSRTDLDPVYENLARSAILAVKAPDVANFLGRPLDPRFAGEAGGRFQVRVEGRRVRHSMGPASVKMYDKGGRILRIETTTNEVSFFKHHRKVEHRDGTSTMKFAPMKKTIHSLGALREAMDASNRRYLRYISELEDPTAGVEPLDRISRTVHENDRPFAGFNLFHRDHLALFRALGDGSFSISGFRNKDLRRAMPGASPGAMSRLIRRLRLHGLVKKAGNCYKYHLTKLGRAVVAAALKLREFVLIPHFATARRTG